LPLSPLATALMLFALTGHAFFASSSHFHAAPGGLTSARSDDAGRVEEQRDAREATRGGGHAQCLLCRLQRDFVSALRHSDPQLVEPTARLRLLARSFEPVVSSAVLLSPPGRAPPAVS
jgi:hypothetical protein